MVSEYTLFFLFLFIILISVYEYLQISKTLKINLSAFWVYLLTLSSFILPSLHLFYKTNLNVFALLLFLPFFTMLATVLTSKKNMLPSIAVSLFAPIYITIPFLSLFNMGFIGHYKLGETYHYEIVLGYFILLWCNDTGAYITGKKFGKHKLFERISPKKTWEGSIGGAALSFLAAWFIYTYLGGMDSFEWYMSACIVVIFGTFGDLFESLLKRNAGIKDSGKILPGHGGVLDRFDGVFLSAPVLYAYLLLVS
ncbi:phosphatidate cytidylyltransferase [Flavobacteriales bacterium]|nr:phosphatidate cytidylyltransferase [Flavobacteriales bacterium]